MYVCIHICIYTYVHLSLSIYVYIHTYSTETVRFGSVRFLNQAVPVASGSVRFFSYCVRFGLVRFLIFDLNHRFDSVK